MIEKLYKVFENLICDECLGRQFSQLLSGTTNGQRGKTLRTFFAIEENLWENIGVDFCEPIKSNINRVIGKEIEKRIKRSADPKNPDINVIIDIPKKDVRIQINPLFIYGEYRKLVRGIPQTKWPSGKYRTSVEQIIAKPLMKLTSERNKRNEIRQRVSHNCDTRQGYKPRRIKKN